MHRKSVFTVAAIVLCSTILTMSFMSMSEEDLDVALTAFRGSTQDTAPTKTEKVIRDIGNSSENSGLGLGDVDEVVDTGDPDIIDSPDGPYVPGIPQDNSNWLSIVGSVKQVLATQVGYYSQGALVEVTMPDGTKGTLRPDCSGYVGFCLWLRGLQGSSPNINSASGSSGGSIPGVTCHAMSELSDYSQLLPGDIVFKSGHVEIIAESPAPGSTGETRSKVYNCGSNDSAANPGVTTGTALGKYTYFWRLN